ncbi:FHA domain-containing serine/threonine-protein kinase [Okeania sp. SIO3I5]|uniref:FHA domain-containing serine/threonine-protein kinase n=1 Tax=Okeania sp. SIO3I5 TaxID=2607805 RepID=UPI0025DCF3D4|nr:FHA domain-containing serine/threonine-protein kinase [Okeania sp. SIO3I5]
MSKTLELMIGGKIPININEIAEIELLELLGTGAFASTWKAIDHSSKNNYVLKVIQGIKPEENLVERIHLEAAVNIPSENIIPVLGLKEWDVNTYLILFEYFPGKPLDELLEKKSLNNRQKQQIFKQILLGTSAAHQCNIIHRDLKPANIIVGDEQTKIIDFGVSKFKDQDITLSREIVGTPAYMAPEFLIKGARVADAKSDIYSLGHILYELSMGENFWQHRGWYRLDDFINYLTQTPPPTIGIDLSDFYCDFFLGAEEVLLQMMKIHPEERYQSVEEVICDLKIPLDLPNLPTGLNFEYPLLIVESGSNKGARTFVNINDRNYLILGRVDIAGADTSISRKHLEFKRNGNNYFVRDLGSKNGTMLKGQIISNRLVKIQHGDMIKVGDVFLRFFFLDK